MALSPSLCQIGRLLFLAISLSVAATPALGQGTRVGFYSSSCPQAESIVRSTVQSHFRSDPTVAPGLLRMHFHDCFVQGCDASILITGPSTERNAAPNLLLRGFDAVDNAKTQIEAACPGVVSCADILALAARDAVVLTGGPSWSVPTGRRDGLVSSASDTANLPAFTDSVDVQKQKFLDKGLDTQDLVTLVGGHTIGTSACQFFRYRLYNFTTTGNGADPSIDPVFLSQLQVLCPVNGDGTRRVALDNGSVGRFDVSYFTNLRNSRGVLESDQKLWADASTRIFVQRFSGPIRGLLGLRFELEFARAMVKMGNIGVKTGIGHVRRCAVLRTRSFHVRRSRLQQGPGPFWRPSQAKRHLDGLSRTELGIRGRSEQQASTLLSPHPISAGKSLLACSPTQFPTPRRRCVFVPKRGLCSCAPPPHSSRLPV